LNEKREKNITAVSPFVKCYLLPPRVIENQRKTRYYSNNNSPIWKETMVYSSVSPKDLNERHLEVSVWDFQSIYKPYTFLGQINIYLNENLKFNKTENWFLLGDRTNNFYLEDFLKISDANKF